MNTNQPTSLNEIELVFLCPVTRNKEQISALKQKTLEQNERWTQIQKAYEDKSQTVKQICDQFKLKQTELYKYAKENDWRLRAKKKNRTILNSNTQTKRQTENKQKVKTTSEQSKLREPTKTLEDALEFITMDLMQRIQKRTMESEADHDKDARTLSSLVRTYEKLKEMKTSPQSSNQKGEQQHPPIEKADEDAKRREIATSLEKLIQGL